MNEDLRLKILQLISEAENIIPSFESDDLPAEPNCDYPKWHGFEHQIWAIGDDIRQLILEKTALRSNREIQKAIVQICTNRNAKRGRQSFLMLLGYKCCQDHAEAIVSQLDDEGVAGHVIDALLKMKTPDYVAEVNPFSDHPTAWIRNSAITYCKRFQKPE